MRIETTKTHTVDGCDLPVTLIKTQIFGPGSPELNDDPYSDITQVSAMATIATEKGEVVHYRGGGKYQVLDTGEILTEVVY